jgi:hypothetical protein
MMSPEIQNMMVSAWDASPKKVRSYTNIRHFVKELLENLGFIAFGEPEIAYSKTGKTGYMLCQLFTPASSIGGYFDDVANEVYLDVFTSEEFRPEIVIETLDKFFSDGKMGCSWKIISRGRSDSA